MNNLIKDYIKNTELDKQITDLSTITIDCDNDNDLVKKIFESLDYDKNEDYYKGFYNFTIPKLGENGSCSMKTEFEQFDLTTVYGERTSTSDLHLWRLYQIINELQKLTNVDWLGIYKKTTYKNSNNDNEDCLLKLAYYGEFSRPIFPLTDYFQTISNNSWVGLNGKSKVIQSLATYEGVYYNCSDKVKSEICIPIFDKNQNVIGIIDAESWKDNHFNSKNLLEIVKVAISLSNYL
ncbi:hypothetical protein ACTFIW_012930 [Dictyostelium discoideum]